jgi:ABC-type transport system involved in cytochrome c biogenesis permease component
VYPLVVPVMIAGTRGSAALLIGVEPQLAYFWMKFLLVFDVVFVALGVWVFESLVGGDA